MNSLQATDTLFFRIICLFGAVVVGAIYDMLLRLRRLGMATENQYELSKADRREEEGQL